MNSRHSRNLAEFSATGATTQQLDELAEIVCSALPEERQEIVRNRIIGTAKNALYLATRTKIKSQTIQLYQRILTAFSVGLAAVASAIGEDERQTAALLLGIGVTLLIQLGKELETVTMPVPQWLVQRQLVERIISEVNGYLGKDAQYALLNDEESWICLLTNCQNFINVSSQTTTNYWSKTFNLTLPKQKNETPPNFRL